MKKEDSKHLKGRKPVLAIWFTIFILLVLATFLVSNRKPTVVINGSKFTVDVAHDVEDRQSGLSGRESIADDEGMLFIFEQEFYYDFWMKDMLFPLDIYWIDDDLEIVYIERNLSPDTYPQSFVSTLPAKYVLELNGGSYRDFGINLGDTVDFKNISY